MAPRRSHIKSRLGCTVCKQRRVKCDEAGPPCGPCTAREIDCQYSQTSAANSSSANRQLQPSTAGPSSANGRSGSFRSLTPVSQERDVLELELMHYWSTSAFKCMTGNLEAENPTWQVVLPREGFRYRFLLDALLSLAALEIVVIGDLPNPAKYLSASLEYHGAASRQFRDEIADITKDKEQAVLAFSLITLVLSLAMPQVTASHDEPQSMIQNMITQFGLLKGVHAITRQSWDDLRRAPILRNVPLEQSQTERLEPDLEMAITRLKGLNEARHNPHLDTYRASKLQAIAYNAACQKAIAYLEDLFGRCHHPFEKGYTLAWLNLAGAEYVAAVENSDPVALLVLMHWGLLAEKCSDGYWWAQSVGRNLVDEVSTLLRDESDPLFRESISWVRAQVRL